MCFTWVLPTLTLLKFRCVIILEVGAKLWNSILWAPWVCGQVKYNINITKTHCTLQNKMHLPKCKNRSWAVNQQIIKHFLGHEKKTSFLISYKVSLENSKDTTVPWTSLWAHNLTVQILVSNTLNWFAILVRMEVACMIICVILCYLVLKCTNIIMEKGGKVGWRFPIL